MTLFLPKNLCFRTKHSFMTPFFKSQFVLCHTSNNTTSQNIGGRMHGPSPTSNFKGTVPQPPQVSAHGNIGNSDMISLLPISPWAEISVQLYKSPHHSASTYTQGTKKSLQNFNIRKSTTQYSYVRNAKPHFWQAWDIDLQPLPTRTLRIILH